MATRIQRLQEFAVRLAAAPSARSFDEAYGQLSRTLNEVEDELSDVAFDIMESASDGRLYPPLWDNIRPLRSGVRQLRSREHVTVIGENGGIQIVSLRSRQVVLDRPGEDGRRVAGM
jgi:hypothetical protein